MAEIVQKTNMSYVYLPTFARCHVDTSVNDQCKSNCIGYFCIHLPVRFIFCASEWVVSVPVAFLIFF